MFSLCSEQVKIAFVHVRAVFPMRRRLIIVAVLILSSGALAEPRSTFSLFGEVTGSAADLYSMYSFNEHGFEQSLRLVRKNCVS
jgi:hypothetical protein